MRGIAYGVGVGPGDPELMTQKAVRIIRENHVIAVPGKAAGESLAYRIAAAMVPEIAQKELVPIHMPMTQDRAWLDAAHEAGARLLERYLDAGRNVVYITLGDPSIYCSFSYLQRILLQDGYTVELVPGVPSFCAAAARLNVPLAVGDEPLHVAPGLYGVRELLDLPGACVLMKSAGHMADVKEALRRSGRRVFAVENCGLDGEKAYDGVETIPDGAGYFSLIVAKERLD